MDIMEHLEYGFETMGNKFLNSVGFQIWNARIRCRGWISGYERSVLGEGGLGPAWG